MDAIAAWILAPANGIQHTNQCGAHRFALAAEQLIGEAEEPAPGEPWQGQCFSGCVQFGLMWTAVARQMGVPVRYVGTVREDTLALLENDCWPNDYGLTFFGHYFAKFWGIHGWEYYDPLAGHMAAYADGEFTKGGFQYTIFADGCDPWDVGIHDPQDFRLLLESLYCPGGACDDANGTCPNP